MSKTASIQDYQDSALRLKINALVVNEDKQFKHNGSHIIYAIDSNVLDLFTNPTKAAITQSGKLNVGTGDVFPNEPIELKQQIARQIGVYIFTTLTAMDTPLITLPHSRKDIANYIQYLLNAMEGLKGSIASVVNKAIAQSNISDTISDNQKIPIDDIATAVTNILNRVYSDSSPLLQHTRLTQLFKDKLIADSEAYTEQWCTDEDEQLLKRLLSEKFTIVEQVRLSEYKNHWLAIMQNILNRPDNLPADDLERNAWILAKIQFINEKLPDNQRLVFITNTSIIIDAANQFTDKSFAQNHIRRPKQFLSQMYDQLFSQLPEEQKKKSNKIEHLIELFLTNLNLANKDDQQDVIGLAQKTRGTNQSTKQDKDFTKQLLHEWTEFNKLYGLDQLSADQSIVTTQYPELKDQKALLSFVHNQSALIDQKVDEAWESFYETSTAASYFALGAEHQLTSLPPPVILVRFPHTSSFLIDIILAKMPVNHQKITSFEKALMQDSQEGSNNNKYLHNVAFSVLFAASGHNIVANQLARRALHFIKNELSKPEAQRDPKLASGREAHFLVAYNSRIIAKSSNELKSAFWHLDQAQRLLLKGATNHGFDYNEFNLRFEAEELSLHLCCHLFDYYCDDKINTENSRINIWSLKDFEQRAVQTIKTLANAIKNNTDHNHYAGIKRLNAIAGFSAASDYLTLSLISEESLTKEGIQLCISCFDISYKALKDYQLAISPLSHCLYYYSKMMSANSKDQCEPYRKKALELTIKGNSRAKYENARLRDLRKRISHYKAAI